MLTGFAPRFAPGRRACHWDIRPQGELLPVLNVSPCLWVCRASPLRIYQGDNFISSSVRPYEVENVVIPFFRWENEAQTDEHLPNQGHVASKGWNLGLSPDHLVLKPEPTSPLQHLPPTDRRTEFWPIGQLSQPTLCRVNLRPSARHPGCHSVL